MPVERIPLFPLDVVLFPGELFELHVFENRYVQMTEEALAEDLPIGIVLARPGQPEDRVEYDPEPVGTAAMIVHAEKVGDRYLLRTVGIRRFFIHNVVSEKLYQEADVEWLDEEPGNEGAALDLANRVLERIMALGGHVDWTADVTSDPVIVSHAIAASLPVGLDVKQRLLEATNAEERLEVEADLLEA